MDVFWVFFLFLVDACEQYFIIPVLIKKPYLQ